MNINSIIAVTLLPEYRNQSGFGYTRNINIHNLFYAENYSVRILEVDMWDSYDKNIYIFFRFLK